jgi:hypothetical protein
VYEEFRRLMETEPELHSEVLNQESSAIPTAIDDLDERFFQLGGAKKLVEHGAAWVRSLPNVAFVPWEQLQSERAAVIARNTLLESRRAERVAALEAAEAENPWYVAAARRLCALRGLTFSRLTTGSITSEPHIMRWGIVTTEGVFYMLIGPEEAELQEAETGKALGTGKSAKPERLNRKERTPSAIELHKLMFKISRRIIHQNDRPRLSIQWRFIYLIMCSYHI